MATQKRFIAKNGLDNNSNTIPNVADPVNSQDVATKNYTSSNFLGSSSSAYPTMYPTLNLDFANSKQLDSRITFTRNSIATYYDGQTTAKAEQNLMAYSISVGGAGWAVVSITTTINAGIAPDNTTTASLLTASAGSGVPRTSLALTGVANIVYTCSIYAKAGTFNILQIYDGSGSDNRWANFDLTSGTLGTYGNCVSSIISIGNGWYRCIVTYTPVSTTIGSQFVMAATSSSGRAAGLTAIGTESWYLWGAQVENRSAVTAYTPTTTSAITNYIPVLMTAPANVARFDCDPITGKSLGLLVEESRTNLLTYSSDFSNVVWAKSTSTLYYNYVIAPDGTQTATLLGPTVSVCPFHTATWVPGKTYVYSVYVKAITGNTIGFRMSTVTTGDEFRTFTASTGTIVRTGVEVGLETATSVGNGWYRLVMVSVARADYSNYVSIEAGEGFAIWGAQLEVSSTTQAIRTSTIGVGSTTTDIVLDSGASSVDGTYVGNKLTISNVLKVISAYVGATKTATVSVAFASAPSSGTTYYITPATMAVVGFATSYIPTVASTVTRAIDAAVMTGTNFSSWYNQSQGTMYVESNSASSSVSAISVEMAASNGTTRGGIANNTGAGIARFAFVNPSDISGGTIVSGSTNKYVGSWVFGGNMSLTLNGSLIGTAVAPVAPSYFNGVSTDYATKLAFYDINSGGTVNTLNGHIKKVMYYPVALSASNLVALTT